MSFLKKIAMQGTPVVCTIHQPSAMLFQMFDHILLLAPGGRTVFFGETGHHAANVIRYFNHHGASMAPDQNPAESIIEVVSEGTSEGRDWAQTWLNSPEHAHLMDAISTLNQGNDGASSRAVDDLPNSAYALPLSSQVYQLTYRHWVAVWRTGPYSFSKLAKCALVELFVAFTFFMAGTDVAGFQNRMIALLIIVWIIPATAADIQDIWFSKWAIFEARERNGIYSYKALLAALMIVEVPWQILCYTIVFLCTYWTTGSPNTPDAAGFVYFMYLILSLFATGFCQLMAAIFPNATLAGYANSLFWVALTVFSGTLVPHQSMNTFYKPWIFWVDPLRYFLGGTVSSVLHNVKAECSVEDLTLFDPPSSQSCASYAAEFLSEHAGYLVNPNATESCAYCRYSYGDDYAQTLDYYHGDRWRDWAVLLGFAIANVLAIWFFTWLYRVKMRK
jgi:ATP-binding cassette subfamily G (WHITE) protein 2 (SNQ2)